MSKITKDGLTRSGTG